MEGKELEEGNGSGLQTLIDEALAIKRQLETLGEKLGEKVGEVADAREIPNPTM
jgi:hypothetical protein